MRKVIFLSCAAFATLVLISLAYAEGTRTWEQSKYEDFSKGTAHGVAISSDGFLQLAPAFKLVATTPSSAVWATAVAPNGDVYLATGAPAKVYRVAPGGQPVAMFQPQELQVQALVIDKHGVIYAATNPDGKVYKLEKNNSDDGGNPRGSNGDKSQEPTGSGQEPKANNQQPTIENGWKASVYFDPGTKYIWALALDDAGNVFVATGDHGEIFRVSPKGEHAVFFKSDEPHIRVLAFDKQGSLIAGSDGSGLIYRITSKGEGFVLYSAPKREITSLAIADNGDIYAAAAGEKRSGDNSNRGNVTIVVPNANPNAGGPAGNPNQGSSNEQPLMLNSSGPAVPGGSEIYRISPDGSPSRLWNSRDDLVYSLAFDSHGRLLAGTGNRGQIYQITGREDYTELIKAGANQVTAFVKAPNLGLYVTTSNLGKLYLLSDAPDAEGSYESDIFDAHVFSKWGRAEYRGKGNVELFARSGNVDNPDRNWSTWKKIDLQKDAEIPAPPARFIQWKAILQPGNPAPQLDSVVVNYLSKNIAPEFDDVVVSVGTRYTSPPRPANLDPGQRFEAQPIVSKDRQSIGVKWTVHDDNDDQTVYSVYYRGDGQTRWLLLKNNLTEKFYSFDAALLPDGGYTVKVVASDAPSHSPQDALTSERESDRFEVDTTPPQVLDVKASVQANLLHVQFRAVDSFSPIKRAEYSVDAGDWHFVEPVGGLSDSKSESYDFTLPLSGEAVMQEHVIVVRAYDRFDNMNSAKTVIAAK